MINQAGQELDRPYRRVWFGQVKNRVIWSVLLCGMSALEFDNMLLYSESPMTMRSSNKVVLS